MKDYESYTIDDFVQDIYFRKWVFGMLPEQDHLWLTWLANHSEKRDMVEQARTIVLGLRVEDIPIDHLDVQEAIDHILEDRYLTQVIPVYRHTWFRIAASIILVFCFSYGVWERFSPARLATIDEVTPPKASLVDERRVITLPDGSKVTLEPFSRLQVSRSFGKTRREVSLFGEAFFDVAKDPTRPFLVNTGKIVTKVVGTSFWIRAYDRDTSISVSVKTGLVSVTRKQKEPTSRSAVSDEIMLTPNQRAVFVRTDEQLIKTLVDKPVIIRSSVQKNVFEFNETPIPQVLKTVGEAYGVIMLYDADALASCNLTASLNNQNLYQKLDLICEAIHASYKVIDGQILLSGHGCN